MKHLLLAILLIPSLLSFSQKDGGKKAQMEALKIQFITEELDLTEEESESFWPVFFLFEKEHKKLRKSIKAKRKEFEGVTLSESELKLKLKELKSLEHDLADLKEKLILDCIPILGIEKSMKLVTVEDKLKKKIGDRIKSEMRRG